MLLIVASLFATGYIWFFYWEMAIFRGALSTFEVVVGCILVIVAWEASRQAFGLVVPTVTLVFLGYVFLGQFLPYPLWHYPISLSAAISQFNMGFEGGMFGKCLGMSANYMFLFILLGALLQVSGASKFFLELGKVAGRKLAGGPGLTAVVSSALVGTTTGSGAANVAITGSFTIPMMKEAGYKPEQAAAIEAAASTGGNIMPPVMGIVAFVLAEFTETPYVKIIAMAAIPAIFYFLCVGLYVQLTALKLKVSPTAVPVNYRSMLVGGPVFIIPLLVLVWLLVAGHSLQYCVFYTLVTAIVLGLMRKETRSSFREWLHVLTRGALLGAKIGVVTAIVGVLLGSIGLTGLGIKLPSLVGAFTGGWLWGALLLTGAVVIILGSGLPPFASYLLTAILCVPVLINLGVPFMQAHFFIYYFAVFALITPPIGLSSIIAAPMAGANYMRTCVEAVKGAMVAWLLPFVAVFAPIVILQPEQLGIGIPKIASCLAAVLFLQVAVVGYYFGLLGVRTRLISAMAVVLFLAFIISENYLLGAGGLALGILLTLWQLRKRRQLEGFVIDRRSGKSSERGRKI